MSEEKKKRRFGAWSKEEKEFIAQNAKTMSVDDIANNINRDPISVSNYIRKTLGMRVTKLNKTGELSSGTDIENSFLWEELEKELTDEELRVFIYHWNRIVIQFKEDVFPTEEMQIIDMIKLEVLSSRTLKQQKENYAKIQDTQKQILELRKDPSIDGYDIKINRMEGLLAAQKAAYELCDKEYNNMLGRKSAMLKELKGTRDQRLKRIEDSKTTFIGWMGEIITNPSMRRELGEYIEKMRLAVEVEEKRLTKPFKYGDDVEDLPLLTADVLEKLEEENKE